MNYLLLNFSSVLLCLIPFALLTGPFLPDLFLSIISLIFLYYIFKKKKWYYLNNGIFKFFIIFNVYLILISIISEWPTHSIKSSFFYFRFTIFIFAVAFLLDQNKKLLKYFTIIFLISFIFALIDGYFQYFNGYSVFGFISEHPSRMTLLLNDNMILGGYLSRLFPLLIALLIYVYPSNFTNIIIGSLLLVSTDVLIFITGERTALGLLFLSTILIITLISKYKLLRIITLVLSIIFISFISFSNSEIRERNIEHTIEQLGLNNGEKINMFSPVHDSMFRSAYKMFQSNPITGIGPNNFRKACSDKRFIINNDTCSTHPHNSFIQIMSETGLIGLGFLLVASYYILQIIVRHIYHIIFIKKPLLSDFQICLVVAMFLTLWPLLPSQNIFNNWINVIYYLPVGFYIFSQQRNKKINH